MCLRLACVRPSASTCALMRTRRHTMHDGVCKIESRSFELSWVYPCLRIVQTVLLYYLFVCVCVEQENSSGSGGWIRWADVCNACASKWRNLSEIHLFLLRKDPITFGFVWHTFHRSTHEQPAAVPFISIINYFITFSLRAILFGVSQFAKHWIGCHVEVYEDNVVLLFLRNEKLCALFPIPSPYFVIYLFVVAQNRN